MLLHCPSSCFFFFNDTATTEIYTLSLHDALPISSVSVEKGRAVLLVRMSFKCYGDRLKDRFWLVTDRKSTRLNSSHGYISYAVFCLKKKKTMKYRTTTYRIR